MFRETHARSVLKALSWRVVATLATIVLVFAFTGQIALSLWVGGLEFVGKLVLYWMHEARRDLVLQSPKHYGQQRGTFSLRSPVRPNPIAASVVELLSVEDNHLTIRGIDCIDGTPLIDLKPYFSSVDSVPNAVVGWHVPGTPKT